MDSSDDEEERLRRWKEHLAAQQTDDEDEGPPPAALLSARRGESSSGRAHSARRRAEQELVSGVVAVPPRDSLDMADREGQGDSIDWMSAMMPQLRQLQHEKDGLQARIKEQERMISRLQQQNQELHQSVDDGAPIDQKEHKIVELAKKNRALTLALDKERAKAGRVAADLKRLQEELEAANRSKESFTGMDARSLPKEVKVAKDAKPGGALAFGRAIAQAADSIPENEQTPEDKIKELTSKLAALNGQVNSQRLANERLKQENAKVKEALKRELGDVAVNLSPAASPNGAKSAARAAPGSPSKAGLQIDGASRVDAQHRREIDKIDRDRRQEGTALQEQVDKERSDKTALKRKLDAAASRVSVLEKETRDLRDKMELVLCKTDNDDELIAALQTEMANMAKAAKDNKRSLKDALKRDLDPGSNSQQLQDKEVQIERQHKIILSLRSELQAAVMRGNEASTRATRAAGMDAAEAEMHKTRLTALSHQLRLVQVEKAKLAELSEVLKRKLSQAEERVDAEAGALRQERQKSVQLERQLASSSAQGSRAGGSASSRTGSAVSSGSVNSRRGASAGAFPPDKVQQLVDRLNSTTEEMEALQESFQRTLGSKEQELRTANELMRDQHQMFQEAQADLEHKLGRVSQMIEAAR
eukprot:CAMPEP_0179490322 /NCGR_PEP_ID=MMETSP0799-20121207/65389_1 /TAXON_ID=46947 /ORGANISM="Geminigera cryophila, Strain CCMP2564" /LENGTH=647 /DNA_ID=CAMNT_0021306491 /DNA_START=87 /DNA_END=2031 /DNA_ORIENTATION=+